MKGGDQHVKFWELVAAPVAVAVIVGALALPFRFFRRRVGPSVMKATGDHGLVLRAFSRPAEMKGIKPKDMLDVEPYWLTDSDFYFRDGIPGPGPDKKAAWESWAEEHGGEGATWRHVLILVQALQEHTVAVLPPDVNVSRFPVAGGIELGPEKEAGGNGLLVRQFSIELDEEPATAVYFPEGGAQNPIFTMAKGDTEAFLIIANATSGRYEWTVDMKFLVDGQSFTLRADDGGRPFVTVGTKGVERSWWQFSGKTWIPAKW